MKKLFSILMCITAFVCISDGHTGAEKEVKCPIDGEEFTIHVTMSYTTFGTKKDFQKYGAIGDLYESMINSCPKCHYSGYEDDIDTSFTQTVKDDIFKILTPYKDAKMNDVSECEIAAKINEYFKRKNNNIASIYLVASYFLRNDSAQISKRKELQKLTISYLQKALDSKEYTEKETYATIYYLIGDLYRRIGDFENAIKYFDMAIKDKDKEDWVEEVAEEQKQLAIKNDDNNDI